MRLPVHMVALFSFENQANNDLSRQVPALNIHEKRSPLIWSSGPTRLFSLSFIA